MRPIPSALFEGTRPRDYWILADDPHPNGAANELYADALREVFERDGWLALSASVAGAPERDGRRAR